MIANQEFIMTNIRAALPKIELRVHTEDNA